MENTILFGNGINRLNSSNISWNDVLDKIKGSRSFNDAGLPNTMIYERVILEKPNSHEDILNDEFETKVEIADMMSEIDSHKLYSKMFDLNIQNYLTTNYDYAFIKSIENRKDINFPIFEYSTEDVYSIRRLKRISNTNEKKKHFWQIHGEIKKPATIMLGLDQYTGSLGKIDSYIKGYYRYTKNKERVSEESIMTKLKTNSFTDVSWIELFFNSNIHIFGFGLDYAESDIWWLFNKRARLKKSNLGKLIKNKITFYTMDIDIQRKEQLNVFDVHVENIQVPSGPNKYNEFYKKLMKTLKSKTK